jgi:periplasmic divalent cation tolerance protein
VVTDKIVVLTTCESGEQAEGLARRLVEQRLAACVNILPGVRSIYRWRDKVEDSTEFVLIIKARREAFVKLREAIAHLHTYEIPEVIALPVVDGSEAYLQWLDREVAS